MNKKHWAWVIGTGILLFAIHNPNQPLIKYIFLPQLGMMLFGIGVLMFLTMHYKEIKMGSKYVYIPLIIIVVSILITSIIQASIGNIVWDVAFAPFVFGLLLFGLYLSAINMGSEIFKPFMWAVIIGSLGCVVAGIFKPGWQTGGWISPSNYDIAVGVLVFGTIVSTVRRQWWLASIATIGVFFTGAPEGLFVVGVMVLFILLRRDIGKRILLPVSLLFIVIFLWFGLGYGQELYSYTLWTADISGNMEHPVNPSINENPVSGRLRVIDTATQEFNLFGHGYTINKFNDYTVHNVPLVIVQQIGIIPAIAWVWVTLYCLFKTRWKYAWVAVIAMCVFDHYIWTQVAPWWWALVGVSTSDKLMVNDYIFRR